MTTEHEGCLRCNETGVTLMDGHLCGRCHTVLFTSVSELQARAVLDAESGDMVCSAVILPSGRVVAEEASEDALEVYDSVEEFNEEMVGEGRVAVDG